MKRLIAYLIILTMLLSPAAFAVCEQQETALSDWNGFSVQPSEDGSLDGDQTLFVEPSITPVIEETPAPEETAVQESEVPSAEETPVPEDDTAQESEAPSAEETPVPEDDTVQKSEAPSAEETPVPEDDTVQEPEEPSAEETPVPETTSEPEETPVPETSLEPVLEETPAPEVIYRAGIILRADGDAGLSVYDAPGGAYIASLSKGQMIEIGTVEAGWTLIRLGDFTGYVRSDYVALYNGEAAPEEKIRSISVSTNLGGLTRVKEGTTICLTATLTGFEEDSYTVQWQYSPDGGASAVNIQGANGLTYAYRLTAENFGYLYRVVVDFHEDINQ